MIDFERIDINEIYIGQLRIKSENLTAEDMPRPWIKIQTEYIRDKYDYSAKSIKDIARTIGVSEKFVREVLKTKIKVKDVPVEGQQNMLGDFKRLQDAGEVYKNE